MDNPEEVLQALDEFSKMRPSEIPRELEDYLCFVAKTGDPVYQWSLIKPLFREKLVRVMTDFYENCPALDLASSPNLDHFNYDIMKCNLLELLESFASAPFTVQRICELLTSPRKEYNRVDKFMRAIEKNILVVSTKEPGPAARRSENGESMLNGSIDDDLTPNNQSQEVEMESWVKDCTSDGNSSADSEQVDKSLTKDVNQSTEESKEPPKMEMTVSGFISAAHDMTSTPLITTPNSVHSESINTANNISNSTEISAVNDVPEAIINEDTSSQPSLDSENDSNLESTKKLQTTFESKDFAGKLNDEDKFYGNEKSEGIVKAEDKLNDELSKCIDEKLNQELKDEDSKSDDESKSSYDSNSESGSPEKRPRLEIDANESDKTDSRNFSVVSSEESKPESRLIVSDTVKEVKADETDNNLLDSEKNDEELATSSDEVEGKVEADQPKLISEEPSTEKLNEDTTEVDTPKPIIEEPPLESSSSSSSSSSTSSPSSSSNESTQESCKADNKQCSSVVIEEAMDDDSKLFSSNSINDPIPIIEEPKDEVGSMENVPVTPVEISDYTKPDGDSDGNSNSGTNETAEVKGESEETEELKVKDKNLVNLDSNSDTVAGTVGDVDAELNNMLPGIPDLTNTQMEKEESMETESMEIDNEEPNPVFQQDEPMEQESGDQIRS